MNRTLLLKPLAVITAVLFLSGCGAANHHSEGGSYKASQAVRAAYSQIGTKYKSGGASPSQGFDCSGLVYWAYLSNGVKVPRMTSQQARAGYAVSKSEAAPGDMSSSGWAARAQDCTQVFMPEETTSSTAPSRERR